MIASAASRRNGIEVLQQGKKTYTYIKRIIYTQGINKNHEIFLRDHCVLSNQEKITRLHFSNQNQQNLRIKKRVNKIRLVFVCWIEFEKKFTSWKMWKKCVCVCVDWFFHPWISSLVEQHVARVTRYIPIISFFFLILKNSFVITQVIPLLVL